jgi:splicing factor 3A subunit 1
MDKKEKLSIPQDIKETIDKIAEFVVVKGRKMEERIIEREKDNPDFDFLRDKDNPFRDYYESKLEEVAKSKGMHVQKRIKKREDPFENGDKVKKENIKKKTQDDLRREINKKKNLKPPPPDQFSIHHPDLHIIDSEIIKLTAQFVTRNGQKFLHALAERQANNPQFDFLKHTHKLFGYFTSLLDSYSKTFVPKPEYINKLKKYSLDQFAILENIGTRYEYERLQILEAKEKEQAKKEKETAGMEIEEELEVDWDDFVIVKIIDFDEEDEKFLEPDIAQMGIDDVSTKINRVEQDLKRELFEMEGVKMGSEIEPGMKIVPNYQKKKRDDKELTYLCPK